MNEEKAHSGDKVHWEKVYTTKSPFEVSWYQSDPRLSLSMIRASGCPRDASIIDIGGGASNLVDRLLDDGYLYPAVLDLSASALEFVHKRLGDRAARVEWFEADVLEFEAPHPYSLWHDRAVFHFLVNADDRKRYRESLLRTLRPEGNVILATFGVGGPMRCSGLDVVQYDSDSIREEFGDFFDLIDAREEIHQTPGGVEQLFNYFHLIRR
ncbi:class I SAM-dependent methyltransferase [Acidihalobacter prosperus]